jgi:hypothetical protein
MFPILFLCHLNLMPLNWVPLLLLKLSSRLPILISWDVYTPGAVSLSLVLSSLATVSCCLNPCHFPDLHGWTSLRGPLAFTLPQPLVHNHVLAFANNFSSSMIFISYILTVRPPHCSTFFNALIQIIPLPILDLQSISPAIFSVSLIPWEAYFLLKSP